MYVGTHGSARVGRCKYQGACWCVQLCVVVVLVLMLMLVSVRASVCVLPAVSQSIAYWMSSVEKVHSAKLERSPPNSRAGVSGIHSPPQIKASHQCRTHTKSFLTQLLNKDNLYFWFTPTNFTEIGQGSFFPSNLNIVLSTTSCATNWMTEFPTP